MQQVDDDWNGMWRAREEPSPRSAASSAATGTPTPLRLEVGRAPARRAHLAGLRRRRLSLALAAATAGTIVFAVLTNGGERARDVDLLLPSLDDTAQALGLGLDQVSVTGHRFTPDGDIFDALELTRERRLVDFDSAAARARIEKLPWVLSADITREFPGRLDVRIVERRPSAVWRLGNREMLIDASGRVLQAVPLGSVTNLPRVAGEDADREAANLLNLVSRIPIIAASFALAERVGGRRWSLQLTNGTRVELPSEGEALVLDQLTSSGALEKMIGGAARIVDLRAKGRVAVRALGDGADALDRVSELAPPTHTKGTAGVTP